MADQIEGAAAAARLARVWLEADPVNDKDALSCARKAAWQLLVAVECLVDDSRKRWGNE